MICPKCNRKMMKGVCIFCGYMENGNVVDTKRDAKITDLEKYFGYSYDKIIHLDNDIETFIFGPVYFCYRKFFLVGIVASIIDIFLYCFLVKFFSYLLYFLTSVDFSLAVSIFLILSLRITWMTIDDVIYLKLVKNKIKRLKKKNKFDKYIINNKLNSVILGIAGFLLYFIIFVLVKSFVLNLWNFGN